MNNDSKDSDFKVVALCLALSIAIFIFDSMIPLGVAGGVPYIAVVLASLWSPRKYLPYYFATLGSLLTISGYFSSPPGGELWKVLFNRTIALIAIWITAFLGVQRSIYLQEREKALNELKILQGIIPICSYCHEIRNEEGAWNQLESYLSKHSEAEFSHGICPQCFENIKKELDLK